MLEERAPTPKTFFERHGLKLALSILFGGGLAWMLARGGLPVAPKPFEFPTVKWWTVALYALSILPVHWFRATRWRFLLRPIADVRFRSIVCVSWIGFAAILMSPLRTGEFVRPLLITKRGPIKIWEATGTVGAERVIDGMIVSGMLFVGLMASTTLSPLPDHIGDLPVSAAAVPKAAYTALAIFFAAFSAMALFYFRRALAVRITHALLDLVSTKLADRVAKILGGVADGLHFLRAPRYAIPFVFESLLYWCINAGGIWLLAWGCGLTGMTYAEACVVVGVVGIGILVPSGPGFFGAFQLSTYLALAMFFPERMIKVEGEAFVFLIYVTQVIFQLVAAVIAIAIDGAG